MPPKPIISADKKIKVKTLAKSNNQILVKTTPESTGQNAGKRVGVNDREKQLDYDGIDSSEDLDIKSLLKTPDFQNDNNKQNIIGQTKEAPEKKSKQLIDAEPPRSKSIPVIIIKRSKNKVPLDFDFQIPKTPKPSHESPKTTRIKQLMLRAATTNVKHVKFVNQK